MSIAETRLRHCIDMAHELHEHANNLIIGADLDMAEHYLGHALKVLRSRPAVSFTYEDDQTDRAVKTSECTDQRCSRINGKCVGMHCPWCGEPVSSMGHDTCRAA